MSAVPAKEVKYSEIEAALKLAEVKPCSLGMMYRGPYQKSQCLFLVIPQALDPQNLKALSLIRHANLAAMVAFAVSKTETCVVYTASFEMLRDRLDDNAIDWHNRLQVALQMARVLVFLSETMCGDLDSEYIGVTPEGTPVLIGIGLAEMRSNLPTMGVHGAAGYRCPVYAQGHIPFDEHAQEFALGVLLLELLTAAAPIESSRLPLYLYVRKVYSEEYNKSLSAVATLMDPSLSEDCAQQLAERFLNLCLGLTSDYPDERPSLRETYKYLEDLSRDQRDMAESAEAAPKVNCSTCQREYSAGVFCGEGHYLCADCLDGLVVTWSTRKHIITKNKGCIFCPKRFEFAGYYFESRKPLCEAAPWRIEDLKEVIGEATYTQYMERVFKGEHKAATATTTNSTNNNKNSKGAAGGEAGIFRNDSKTPLTPGSQTPPVQRDSGRTDSGTASPLLTKRPASNDVAGLVKAVDDYGTIMTTLHLEGEAKSNGRLDEPFFKRFEQEKRKLEPSRSHSNSFKASFSEHPSYHAPLASPVTNVVARLAAQQKALTKLYESLDGGNWRRHNNWGKTRTFWGKQIPVSEWYSVSANDGGDVTELDLHNNRLKGVLPAEVCTLFYLRMLNMSHNLLRGALPKELGQLANLTGLNLNNNLLEGSIPAEITRLGSLVSLDLSYNKLQGTIPAGLSALADLKLLALNNNLLTGDIPIELSALKHLELLGLHCNRLTGPMTDILKANPKLKMTY